MVTTLSTLNKQRYLDALDYENPDSVLGDLMSDYHYSLKLPGIIDPCDWLHHCSNQNVNMTPDDRQIIQHQQPMFYNARHHRAVNRQDVIRIIKAL